MPILVSQTEREEILSYYRERFGIADETFARFCFVKEGKAIWVVSKFKGLEEFLNGLNIRSAGIPFLRLSERWKPTTAGLRVFGSHATKNVANLEGQTLTLFLKGETVRSTFPVEYGYVVVRWKGNSLGCGLYSKKGLKSQIPLERSQRVKGLPLEP